MRGWHCRPWLWVTVSECHSKLPVSEKGNKGKRASLPSPAQLSVWLTEPVRNGDRVERERRSQSFHQLFPSLQPPPVTDTTSLQVFGQINLSVGLCYCFGHQRSGLLLWHSTGERLPVWTPACAVLNTHRYYQTVSLQKSWNKSVTEGLLV